MPNMSKMLDMSQMSRDVEICRQYVQIHTNMMGYVTNVKHVKDVRYVANVERC